MGFFEFEPPVINKDASFLESDKTIQSELGKSVKKYHSILDVKEFIPPIKGDMSESIFISAFKSGGYDIIRMPENSPGVDYILSKHGRSERVSHKSGHIEKIKGTKYLTISSYRLAGKKVGDTLEDKIKYIKEKEKDIGYYYCLIERKDFNMYQVASIKSFFDYDNCKWELKEESASGFAEAEDINGSILRMSGPTQSYMLWVSKPINKLNILFTLNMY